MKKLTNVLKNFITGSDKKQIEELVNKYGDEILATINYTYKGVGGCSISKKEDILKECDMCKLYIKDGKILAVSLYADKSQPNEGSMMLNDKVKNNSKKIIVCATAKGCSEYLKKIIAKDFSTGKENIWGEFNINAANLAIQCGAIPIPIEIAETIMKDKTFYDKKIDSFVYTRRVGSTSQVKILMGDHLFVDNNVKEKPTEEEIQHFKSLVKKYAVNDDNLKGI